MKRALLLPIALLGCTESDFGTSSQPVSCTATTAFAETVCICDQLKDVGNFIVGTSVASDTASLAVMGTSRLINNTQIRGNFLPHGGLVATGNLEVTGSLASGATVDDIGNIDIGGDLRVGGDLKGIGRLGVGGALSIAGTDRFIGYKQVSSTAPFAQVAPPQCGCDPTAIVDIPAAVAQARAQNDNAAHGIPTSIRAIGLVDVKLPTGSYYFTDLSAIGATRLVIDGHVSMYLDGDLEHIGAAWIRIENGGMLDLYVSGSVKTIGHVDLGNKWEPSAFRLYIGGSNPASLSVGNQLFNGGIYAPTVDLTYVGNTKLRGGVTARTLLGIGNLEIGYAKPECPSEDPPSDPPPPPSQDDPPVIL